MDTTPRIILQDPPPPTAEQIMSRLEERMSEAVTRLALVEERQAAASTALERLVQTLEKVDERLRRLEVAEPMQAKATEWVQSAVWAAAAAAVMFMAGKAGLF